MYEVLLFEARPSILFNSSRSSRDRRNVTFEDAPPSLGLVVEVRVMISREAEADFLTSTSVTTLSDARTGSSHCSDNVPASISNAYDDTVGRVLSVVMVRQGTPPISVSPGSRGTFCLPVEDQMKDESNPTIVVDTDVARGMMPGLASASLIPSISSLDRVKVIIASPAPSYAASTA